VNLLSPLLLTLRVAIVATLLAGLAAVPLARVFARRHRGPFAFLQSAFLLPLVLPPTTLGYYLLLLLGRRTFFGRFLEDRLGIHLVFDWKGAAVAAAVVSFPLFYQTAATAFSGVDRRLEEAARMLGAAERGVFWTVTLPLAARGVLAGAVLAFARSVGDFGATLLVAGNIPGRTQTMSLAIYDALSAGDDARALALVGVTTALAYGLLVVVHRRFPPRLA
jgi:molybdate transport system permease protein